LNLFRFLRGMFIFFALEIDRNTKINKLEINTGKKTPLPTHDLHNQLLYNHTVFKYLYF
jgi:hypothetical protein